MFRYIIYLQQSDSALCKLSLLRIYRIFFFLHCKSHIGTTANPISSLYLKNIVISALFPAYFCLVQVEERQKQDDKLQHSPGSSNKLISLQRGDIDKLVNPVNNYSGPGWGELRLSAPLHRHIIMCHSICNI